MSKEIVEVQSKEVATVESLDNDYWSSVFFDLNLTLRQKTFIIEYVSNSGNATKAAYKAYTVRDDNSAAVMGSKTLRLPKVTRAVDRALEVAQITPEWIKKEIKAIAKDEEVPAHTRLNALSNLGKAEGMYVEKKIVGHIGKIQVDWN